MHFLKDEFGDYDFETPKTLDLELINIHLKKLADGEEVIIPYYDFKEGKRDLDQRRYKFIKMRYYLSKPS